MNEIALNFIYCTIAVISAVIILKIFSTLWLIIDKKYHPEKIRATKTPETAFGDLKGKIIDVYLKDGKNINSAKYIKTLFFNDGEFAMNTTVYFQLLLDEKIVFVAGSDIQMIKQL